jgi:hypothetical protein
MILKLARMVKEGDLEGVIEYLDRKKRSVLDNYALRWSARCGHLNIVKYLVEDGVDIHSWDDKALCLSVYYRKFDVVEYLLSKGASIYSAVIHCDNIEVKRDLCEYFGWEKVIEGQEMKVIHSDKYGILLEDKNIEDDGWKIKAKFVRVICPSTGRKYVLRVDPNVQTAKEAVASTFGLTEEQYCPIVER